MNEQQPEAFGLLRLADMADQGALPESGGVLDQCAPLMDAIEELRVAISEGRAEVAERDAEPAPGGGSPRGPRRGRKAPLKPQRLGRR